jgi:N-carbamoyl-L-amino-acid hydrolase
MVSSGVFGGKYSLEKALAIQDADGRTLGAELERIGYAGDAPCGGRAFAAFFEAHIEQGPILEAEDKTIGIVTGAQCQRWYDASLIGQDSHAGTTPMPMRRDAVFGMARLVSAIDDLVAAFAPDAVGTVGEIAVVPNSRNTVPGRVDFTIDLRHPDPERMQAMHEGLHSTLASLAEELSLDLQLRDLVEVPETRFDLGCIEAVRRAAEELGHSTREMLAGAGHDAMYISRVAPASMIFVPCEGGLSHNEAESAAAGDLAAGCDVLLHAMVEKAGIARI